MRRDGTEISTFDAVFDQTCSNAEIFERVMPGIVESALAGFNTAVCAYGQSRADDSNESEESNCAPAAGYAFAIPRFVPTRPGKKIEQAEVEVQTCYPYIVDQTGEVLTLKKSNSSLADQLATKTKRCLELEKQKEECVVEFASLKSANRLEETNAQNETHADENSRLNVEVASLKVFRTCDGRGWVVRALRSIRKGAFIGEYTGELLSDAETARPERTDTYFFETRVGERLYTVDARMYGNFTRFINHSCRPNATVGMVVWEAQLEQLSHICIFATENIPQGVEITISYGQSWWDAKLRLFSCRCGHSICEYTEERRKAELLRLTSHLGVDAHTRSVSTVSSSSSDDSDEMRSV
ncbi:hypothetical protein Q1695_010798 [Nippostrongylus brasiliensis]|nr:hypothetical protein Q1695_010798 [Nippostrongylus brasiliensis]